MEYLIWYTPIYIIFIYVDIYKWNTIRSSFLLFNNIIIIMKKIIFLFSFLLLFFTFHLKSQDILPEKIIKIREYGMKKPGVVVLAFLEENNGVYKEYLFSITLKKWRSPSCIRIAKIKCDSLSINFSNMDCRAYLQEFMTESEFNNSCRTCPDYIYNAIYKADLPIKLDCFLKYLLQVTPNY